MYSIIFVVFTQVGLFVSVESTELQHKDEFVTQQACDTKAQEKTGPMEKPEGMAARYSVAYCVKTR